MKIFKIFITKLKKKNNLFFIKNPKYTIIKIVNNINFNENKFFNKNQNLNNFEELWIQCEECYKLYYKKFLIYQNNTCEYCGYHFNITSLERIKLLLDKNSWNSFEEYLISKIIFYKEKMLDSQNKMGLTEAIQIGIGKINEIKVSIGIMDFCFIGGSMGSVVGEKIICLIKYTILKKIPLVLFSASGGARMQEGSISLMQMSKISSILVKFQIKLKLLYISILTSPTTGGVTSSFGMLGNIIIAEPNSTISFAGKRVIEQTLNKILPDNSQTSEYLFHKGLFDIIIPRNLLKNILFNLFLFHNYYN